MVNRSGGDVVTAHALKLALLPGWDEHRAARQLIRVADGNGLALRRAKARLEAVLVERHSRVVDQAVSSLRAAIVELSPPAGGLAV